MQGAIRVSGRWVEQQLLERICARAQGPNPPGRRELVEHFARAAHWQDAKGQLRLASAAKALRGLERRGLVQLPPVTARAQRRGPRKLRDDGQPLPPPPSLPQDGRPIAGLRLVLIRNERDPAHLLWNRLITREHPLGGAPLFGAQLRYLIQCDQGTIGAFGFGPPAFHLECRDQWIGWSRIAREQNRQEVIGLSRFLIRPALRVRNLASRCYSLVLRQVAADWQARYGIRPVLVETYVNRVHHNGVSLAAANWRRLGQSKGRGRDDRQRHCAQGLKDVWVYQLHPRARALLTRSTAPLVAPRSVFTRSLPQEWAQQELESIDLGDRRLAKRLPGLLNDRLARPTQSYSRSFSSRKQTKAAYRLVENPAPEINFASLLAPHQLQTSRRIAAEKIVLMAQDTTALSYHALAKTSGLGPIGEDFTRGLLLHSLQAFRLDGIPLGTAWAELWARPPQSDVDQRNSQSVGEKESGRWLRALQAAAHCAGAMPQTQMVVCGDRESDIYELYDQKAALPQNVHLLVRGQHDRCLSDGTRLFSSLRQGPASGTFKVTVPRRPSQPARQATLEIRFQSIQVEPPAVGLKKSWSSLSLWAVLATEVPVPKGGKPIQWLLLTTWPIRTFKMARRAVRWYALRWGIECWHRVLKVVCGVERRQFKSDRSLGRALALDMMVAHRILLLVRLGKENPDLPAKLFYSDQELKVLELKKKRPESLVLA